MKESYSFLRTWLKPFAVALALVYSPQLTLAADIDITASFPDPAVQAVLKTSYDQNGDGILQESEQTFTSLYLYDQGVTDLTGVELLTWLTSLDVSRNSGLTDVNVKKLVNLEYLYASETGIISIDVSGLTKLTSFSVTNCANLATITAEGCTSLTEIYSYGDSSFPSLTTLNLSGCTAMTTFYASGEKLESLDLTGCTGLTFVSASYRENLTSLTLTGCTNLTSLSVTNNAKLATLTVSGMEKLEMLYLDDNPSLSNPTLTGLPALKSLYVYNTPGLTSLDVSDMKKLETLHAYNTGLTAIDVSGLTALTSLQVYGCANLATITAVGCTSLPDIYSYSDSEFPSLTTLNLSGCTAMTTFYASGEKLESLDLTGCTGLTFVSASYRENLTSLTLTGCTNLTSLSVTNNAKLATLTVSGMEKLEMLYLDDNPSLSNPTLTGLPALKSLYVYNTPGLTSLDVSDMKKLETLHAYNTGLTAIDVSGLTALTSLQVYGCANLATITAVGCTSLPDIYNFADSSFPSLTTLNLSGCTSMTYFTAAGELLESVDLTGCTGLTDVTASYRKHLTTLKLDGCTALTNLTLENNDLMTSCDVSMLPSLKYLSLYDLPLLESVNFGEGKALETVYLYNNPKLETLTVVSPTLTYLSCSNNSLTSLDVTQCPEMINLDCSYNKLTSLDLSKNTKLTSANTTQSEIETEMVYLSATEVAFAVSPDFNTANVVSLTIDGLEQGLKFTTVDGVTYFVVYGNAADAEEALKEKDIRYGYDTGLEGYALYNRVVITGYTKAPSFLTVDPTSVKGVYGGTVTAPTLTRSQDYDGKVTYKSGNAKVVKVASDGKLTIVGAGETTITVSGAESIYRLAPEDVTYGVIIEKASPRFKFAKPSQEMIISDEVPENVLNKGVYDGTVVYKSSDETVATIASDGKITIVAAGEVTFTASGAATKNCNEPTAASYKLTILKCTATMTVEPTAVEGVYGGKLTAPKLDKGGYDGTVKYETSDANVVKVSSKGALTIVGAGEATITISGAETAKYYATRVTYTATIAKADVAFSYEEESQEMFLNSEVPANKLDKGIYDGTVRYKSSDTNVATIANDGTITVLATGTVTITASGAATDNCNKATAASYKLTIMLPGDLNNDGKVDEADFKLISDCIMSGGYDKKYDLNGDEKVNAIDLVELANMAKNK